MRSSVTKSSQRLFYQSVIIMEPLQNDTQSNIASSPVPSTTELGPAGLLLCRDLIFITKVTGTAQTLGYHMQVAGDVRSAESAIETLRPQVIFVDLTAGELAALEALGDYIKFAGPDVWFVAFGPHVEEEALAAAKAAGCQAVLPRSKFAADLPRLMRWYFSRRPGDGC
jgi:CheY-like chemotaxis protein